MNHCLSAVIVIVAALGIGSIARAGQQGTLGSGKSVDVIAVAPIQLASAPAALMLKYRTTISLSDENALHREVDEVWDRFAPSVEKGKYQSAIISANGPDEGVILKHSQGQNFVFEKQNGNWRELPAEKGKPPVLNEQVARNVMGWFDQAVETNEMNTALLYLGDNWNLAISYTGSNPPPAATQSRIEFATTTYRAFQRVKDMNHTRQINKVTVAPDGASAEVESSEVTTGTADDKSFTLSEQSVDTLGVQNGVIVLTKSTSVATVH